MATQVRIIPSIKSEHSDTAVETEAEKARKAKLASYLYAKRQATVSAADKSKTRRQAWVEEV